MLYHIPRHRHHRRHTNDHPGSLAARPWLLLLLAITVLLPQSHGNDQIPGTESQQPVALVGATIHPVSSPPIEHGVLVFAQGRITAVGKDVPVPDNATVIKIGGRHVYPSLIESYSQIGLTEISAVRATRDERETGDLNPNVEARISVNPDSELIPVTRSNGVLVALSAPTGGLISGRSSVMQLDGWTFEDMTLKSNAAMHVNWPRSPSMLKVETDDDDDEKNDPPGKQLDRLRELFADARTWHAARLADPNRQPFDLRLDAMQPVLDGRLPLIVAADDLAEIQSAVAFATREKCCIIILGGYDAPLCAELLRQHDIPVIVSAIHRLPRRRHDEYDAAYTLPSRLFNAGIRYCISGSDRSASWNIRNLPYHASTAAAYGLPRTEALKSVTLYPAQVLGVDDRIGSLQPGRDATLIVTTGDPLETSTQIRMAWIQGRRVDLTNRHTQLYRKYQRKYKQLDQQPD